MFSGIKEIIELFLPEIRCPVCKHFYCSFGKDYPAEWVCPKCKSIIEIRSLSDG